MKLIRSFAHAFRGLSSALREEQNLRIHFLALIIVGALGFYFRIETWEWCVLILTGALVISLELVNTAIENWTDLVTREQNPLVGKIKDISAAAVLVAAIGSVVIGICIFGKYVLDF